VTALTVTVTVTDSTGGVGTATASCTIQDAFVLGQTEPTAANTGLNVLGLTTADIPAAKIVNGDLTVNDAWVAANGSMPTRWWVKGFVNFTATTPVKFHNSIFEGRTFTGTAPREAIIRARNGSAPVTATISFENCLLKVVQPDVGISTAAGERLGSFYRCDISGGSDLIDYWAPSVPDVRGCYLHDYTFWDNDPKHTNDGSHPGWSHNDLIQNSGSVNGRIRGNSLDCRAAAGTGDVATLISSGFPDRDWGTSVMFTPSTSTITGVEVEENWLYGGQCPICLPLQSGGSFNTGNSWTVRNNRHGDLPHKYGTNSRQIIRWGNTMGPAASSCSGNVFLSTAGVPAALQGTALPAAILQGNNDASGQLMVRVLQT
jgi:hypothetical protein